jgi:hypothetical protein
VKTTKNLSGDEQRWVKRLIKKHGRNVGKMFLDHKTNVMQWSKGEIERKLKIFDKMQREDE